MAVTMTPDGGGPRGIDPRRASDAAPKPAPWNDPIVRGFLIQAVTLAVLSVLVYLGVTNIIANLNKNPNLHFGLGFLGQVAGFDVSQSLIEFDRSSTYGRALIVGILNTVVVSIIGIFLATILGFVIGIARLSTNWLIRQLATIYVEVIRNVPLLLILFFVYFGVIANLPSARQAYHLPVGAFLSVRGLALPKPIFNSGAEWIGLAFLVAIGLSIFVSRWAKARQIATGQQFPALWTNLGLLLGLPILAFAAVDLVRLLSGGGFLAEGGPITVDYPHLQGFNIEGGWAILPEAVALVLGLVIYTASYISEVVRAGINAVAKGQKEAGKALGLSNTQMLRLVVVPQALRVAIPPLTNQYLNLTKNSSLAVSIGYPDLVAIFAGTVLNQTGQSLICMPITMMIYLVLSLLTSFVMNWYNSRSKLVER